jgi:hypothetical protein
VQKSVLEQGTEEEIMSEEQKKLNTEEEISTFLEGMGFEADEERQGLYRKTLDDGSVCYWDFRKTPKGNFYVPNNNGDGFWPDKKAKALAEYIEVRRALGGEEKQPRKKEESKEKPVYTPTSLAVLENKNQAFDLMNQRDDTQVLLEIQGGFMEEFVYSFPTKEGKVTGLSWVGTKEVARQMGNISVEDCDIMETAETFRVKCRAKDIARNVTMFGVAEQSKKMKLRSGEESLDLHALSKAVSRAQRNAIRGLIPEIFIKKMIEQYVAGG